MIEGARKRGGQPGNRGGKGRPKSLRPLGETRHLRLYEDQSEWFEGQGGVEYLRSLLDWHKANPVPLYSPEDLIV